MLDTKIYNTKDLVLKVNPHYDPAKLDLKLWDNFLDILCQGRTYQKQAIQTAIIYLASENYKDINDLVRENFIKNEELRTRYRDLDDYHRSLQLKGLLSATIDIATGGGKSYVMYGIAQIMMGLGLVDRALVLCPSTTIEKGLQKKFLTLVSDSRLKAAIPDDAKIKNFQIVDANQTVMSGDICIENVHAVYENTGSSIEDSFGFGRGSRTLVLNDEVHHVYNKTSGNDLVSKKIKKWKSFLLDTSYGFRYVLGFTGTAYIENDYFNDVIFRYSLRQAVEDGVVKKIDYVAKDDSSGEDQKFQKIWQNHQTNKEVYTQVRPLSILVTSNVIQAKRLETRLVEFLSKQEDIPEDEIREHKVLTVTSDKAHKGNVLRLEDVDDPDETIEWIISVSMLTEGWDVKNVFQIVPMEERAFNSKLLIAQVLGRGLRLPDPYPQSRSKVFNHDSWSSKIKGLVDELLEIEMKLTSSALEEGDRKKYHFSTYNIDYKKEFKVVENNDKPKVFNYSKETINFESAISSAVKTTTYQGIGEGSLEEDVEYKIQFRMTPVVEVVNKIYNDFKTREWEGVVLKLKEGEYTKNNLPPKSKLEEIIRNSMRKAGLEGDEIDERNKLAVFSAFNTLLRKTNKSVIPTRIAQTPQVISTRKRDRETLSIGSLRSTSTVFYTSNYQDEIKDVQVIAALEEAIEEMPRRACLEQNPFLFKTPVDIVFTTAEPERLFVQRLCKEANASKISAWLKSRSQNFYSIEYSISSSNRTKQRSFNPDFLIKIEEDDHEFIIVVEIKSDKDYSDENKAKFKWATIHFEDLNRELKTAAIQQTYIFHFLSPENYDIFFQYLRDGKLTKGMFVSHLDNELSAAE